MNQLEQFFRGRKTSDIHKWSNYFDIYERYFSKFRGQPICFLEIGVDRGGSLEMWKDYFGEGATIVGVDIQPGCKAFQQADKKIYVEIGDQNDPAFLNYLQEKYHFFDIILDDGSHQFEHQRRTLEQLWPYCSELYLVEDTCTSYYPDFYGGRRVEGTFIEYSKNLIDEIHFHHRFDTNPETMWSSTLYGLHFYSGMVVLEKKATPPPYSFRSGRDAVQLPAQEAVMERLRAPYLLHTPKWRLLLWHLKYWAFRLSRQPEKMRHYALQFEYRKALRATQNHGTKQ